MSNINNLNPSRERIAAPDSTGTPLIVAQYLTGRRSLTPDIKTRNRQSNKLEINGSQKREVG